MNHLGCVALASPSRRLRLPLVDRWPDINQSIVANAKKLCRPWRVVPKFPEMARAFEVWLMSAFFGPLVSQPMEERMGSRSRQARNGHGALAWKASSEAFTAHWAACQQLNLRAPSPSHPIFQGVPARGNVNMQVGGGGSHPCNVCALYDD